jgi:iron complex transport system substrate-binding protein
MSILLAAQLDNFPIQIHILRLYSTRYCGKSSNHCELNTSMRYWTRRSLCILALLLMPFATTAAFGQDTLRSITDSAGRRVEIPQGVSRVLAAGPPASILLYTLAPEKMIGWVRTPSPSEKAFLKESVRDLPEYGRLTGRGSTANLENILKFKPDLIIDIGNVGPTYVSLANNVQEQTKVPYVILDGTFNKTPEMYRLLGELLGVQDRADELARYADETLNGLQTRIAAIPESERPRVYYGRGINGLETGLAGSINLDVLERVGAINVAAAAGTGGLIKVSMEQVLSWNPDVILVLDPAFYRSVATDPLWASMKAVQNKRIYLAPTLPYGWFDAPPGVNRLIGVRWLTSILYPKQFTESLQEITRQFYQLFYQVDLTDDQVSTLLATATLRKAR